VQFLEGFPALPVRTDGPTVAVMPIAVIVVVVLRAGSAAGLRGLRALSDGLL
jgi:hypothetical protein